MEISSLNTHPLPPVGFRMSAAFPLLECARCGAAVGNVSAHARWHAALERIDIDPAYLVPPDSDDLWMRPDGTGPGIPIGKLTIDPAADDDDDDPS